MRGRSELRSRITEAQVRSLVEQYDGSIRYTLEQVANVLALLRARVYEGALVVLTSTHGQELFEHGGFGHGHSLHREVLHVPLYIKLPGQREAQLVETPVSLLDVYPTILDALGLPAPPVDGRSLLPLLRGEPAQERVFLLQQSDGRGTSARGIVDGRYKLIDVEKGYDGARDQRLLYDVLLDPGEARDVSEQGPEIVERLSRQLEAGFAAADAARRATRDPNPPGGR
jgi:arylsulfatase A-like enzyme